MYEQEDVVLFRVELVKKPEMAEKIKKKTRNLDKRIFGVRQQVRNSQWVYILVLVLVLEEYDDRYNDGDDDGDDDDCAGE